MAEQWWASDPVAAPAPAAKDAWWANDAVVAAPEAGGINQRAGSFATGINDALAAVAGAPMDISAWLGNQLGRGVNYLTGSEYFTPREAIGGSGQVRRGIEAMVGRAEPQDTTDRLLYGAGQGIGSTVAGMGVGGALAAAGRAPTAARALMGGNPIATTALGAASGAGGVAGEEIAGDDPTARTVGGLLGALAPGAVVAGGALLRGARPSGPRVTSDDMKAVGREAYAAADEAGIVIKPEGMQTLQKRVIDDFTEHAFLPANEPGAAAILGELGKQADSALTLKGLDSLRKMASNAFIPGNQSNNKLIGQVIGRIDELVESGDTALLAGIDTKAGAAAIKEARDAWSKAKKLETVEKFVARGEAVGGSQINQDIAGATRRQVRTLLTNEAKARGFTEAELDAARRAAGFSPTQQAMHALSALLPRGQLGAMLHGMTAMGGGALGGPLVPAAQLAGMGVGYGARRAGEALQRRNMAGLLDVIAGGSPPAFDRNAAVLQSLLPGLLATLAEQYGR